MRGNDIKFTFHLTLQMICFIFDFFIKQAFYYQSIIFIINFMGLHDHFLYLQHSWVLRPLDKQGNYLRKFLIYQNDSLSYCLEHFFWNLNNVVRHRYSRIRVARSPICVGLYRLLLLNTESRSVFQIPVFFFLLCTTISLFVS